MSTLTALQTNFTIIDGFIISIYLIITLVIGYLFKGNITSMKDFITADQKVGKWLGVATLASTEMGLITIMYSAQKGFSGGAAACHIAVIAGMITFLVGFTGFIVAPLRQTGVLTIPEYYEKRFGKKIRVIGAIILSVAGILNMGLFLKVGAMFIVGVTGLSASSIALPLIMTGFLMIVLLYTFWGGMLTVIITDYIQFVLLGLGLLLCVGLGVLTIGWENLFDTAFNHFGEAGFNPFSKEGAFGWTYVIWMMITAGLVSCAIWPTAVARALSAESPEVVKKQYMWSSITFMCRFLLPYFLGLCALVMIIQSADLYSLFFETMAGDPSMNTLYALPLFLGKILPTGVLGCVVAAMVAAFMSTHDGYLLCWSSVITQDIIEPLKKNPVTEKQKLRWTRWIIVAIGVYILYWGLGYQGSDDIWDYMAITGGIYFSGAMSLLIFGLYWKKASTTGALWALCAGMTAIIGLEPIRNAIGLMHWTSAEIGLLSIGCSISAMILGSLMFPDKKELHRVRSRS